MFESGMLKIGRDPLTHKDFLGGWRDDGDK